MNHKGCFYDFYLDKSTFCVMLFQKSEPGRPIFYNSTMVSCSSTPVLSLSGSLKPCMMSEARHKLVACGGLQTETVTASSTSKNSATSLLSGPSVP